jgi:branched-chain amino acid transport system ATP-binding protein
MVMGGVAMLEARRLAKRFGGLMAVLDLSLLVEQGEIVGLIGPNGAGKTTLFNLLSGFYKPTSGAVFFDGEDITKLKPNKIAARGLVRTFQLVSLVKTETVMTNVLVALHLQREAGVLASVFGSRGARRDEQKVLIKATELLTELGLEADKDELVSNLPHGLQKALGIAVALATRPRMVLLDEPTAGISAAETAQVMALIRRTRESGVTVMLVEHDLKVVMGVCDRVVVMNFGRKIAEGTPEEVSRNKEVIAAYLGFEGISRHG